MSSRVTPIIMVTDSHRYEQGEKARYSNIQAGHAVADIIRTTLGPKSMLKMLLDPLGGIVLTADGNAILREIDMGHPAAKTLVELSRAQDEEVGDGTTSVVLLAGEILSACQQLLEKKIHPTTIVSGLLKMLDKIDVVLDKIAHTVNIDNIKELQSVVTTCLSTKISSRYGDLIPALAVEAAITVCDQLHTGKKSLDLKKYVKIESIRGGEHSDSYVLKGVVINKDIVHAKMRRRIENPRIVLIDTPLEYKKGESQTNIEITNEQHWSQILKQEEEEVEAMCNSIINVGCDVVITEKGVSDIAQHFLAKANISVLRRVKKSDNVRLERISGARIVSRPSELTKDDVGTRCRLFEIQKIGDEYYSFFSNCQNPKACTIVLRGGSKDIASENTRNLQDALSVARCLLIEPKILPGGGAAEMAVSAMLYNSISDSKDNLEYAEVEINQIFDAVVNALEIIPKTLIGNCGGDILRTMTTLRSKHTQPGNENFGINGYTGELADMSKLNIWDSFVTRKHVIKSAIEAAAMLLRIDEILSATSKADKKEEGGPQQIIE